MSKYLLAALVIGFPLAVSAEPALDDCRDHFLGAEMPNVSKAKQQKTKLLCFTEYAVLHSGVSKTPVYSAEFLTSDRVDAASGVKRKNNFHAESKLPEEERAELDDYKDSGFDRGHMAPSGDMPTAKAQRESFSLANMVPQNACLNEELWEGIESAVRQLATDEEEVYVVTGPIYPKDPNAQIKAIGEGSVLVPTEVFKAIYVPSVNQAGAYVAKNEDTKEFRSVSLEQLQDLAGIEVFPKLKQKVKATAMSLPAPHPPKFKCRLH
jgi:endonuclease G, mitochondrial